MYLIISHLLFAETFPNDKYENTTYYTNDKDKTESSIVLSYLVYK